MYFYMVIIQGIELYFINFQWTIMNEIILEYPCYASIEGLRPDLLGFVVTMLEARGNITTIPKPRD